MESVQPGQKPAAGLGLRCNEGERGEVKKRRKIVSSSFFNYFERLFKCLI